MSDKREFVCVIIDRDGDIYQTLEADLRDTFQNMLTVVTSRSFAEAMEGVRTARERQAHIPMVMVDVAEGRHDAADFLESLRVLQPTLRGYRIMLGTSADRPAVEEFISKNLADGFLQKPWTSAEVYRVLKDFLSNYILRYAQDQLTHYESLVSHRHYRQALEASERSRVALQEQIGRFAKNLLDVRTTSDRDLLVQLAMELTSIIGDQDHDRYFHSYQPGAIILQQGSVNDRMEIILEGHVVHVKTDETDDDAYEVYQEQEGAIIGSLSFLSLKPIFSTVKAQTQVRTLSLDQSLLDRAMSSHPHFLISFTNLLLRQVMSRVRKNIEINVQLRDTLQELKRAQLQLIEAEKMATLGQLVAGVAHELNNPAAAIGRSAATLSEHLAWLFASPPESPAAWREAHQVFSQGHQLQPLPTRTIREKTTRLQSAKLSPVLARQAVEMGFADEAALKRLERVMQDSRDRLIPYLNHYYLMGQNLRIIASCSDRIGSLVHSLKNYAREDQGKNEWLDLHQGLEETLMMLQHRAKHFEIVKEYGSLPQIYGRPGALNQLWTNLLTNAFDAMGANGTLVIKTRRLPGQPRVQVCIRDSGLGIPADIRDKIFELNFTTKRQTGFGLGLGLAICKNIVENHGGTIDFESQVGQFTEFRVTLPLEAQVE